MAPTGPLPTFVIIGAMRSGTTALFRYVSTHPDVFTPAEKELHFFDRNFDRGVAWYREQFAGAGGARAVGEATPNYLARPGAPGRMASIMPDARLVAILRNPVDRAYSHFRQRRARRKEARTFASAIEEELAPRRPGQKVVGAGYLAFGRYLGGLQRFAASHSREQLQVHLFEDLVDRPGKLVADVFTHIGVDAGFVPPNLGHRINDAGDLRSSRADRSAGARLRVGARRGVTSLLGPREDEPIDPELRRMLVDEFRADNAALAAWLERDLSAWNA